MSERWIFNGPQQSFSVLMVYSPAASIKSVAADMAKNMMSFYKGSEPGQTPGLLPKPYYCEPVIRGKSSGNAVLMADKVWTQGGKAVP